MIACDTTTPFDDYFRSWRDRRHAAKHLARMANATPRAAENWLAARSKPNVDNLLVLMRADPTLREIVIQLTEPGR